MRNFGELDCGAAFIRSVCRTVSIRFNCFRRKCTAATLRIRPNYRTSRPTDGRGRRDRRTANQQALSRQAGLRVYSKFAEYEHAEYDFKMPANPNCLCPHEKSCGNVATAQSKESLSLGEPVRLMRWYEKKISTIIQ